MQTTFGGGSITEAQEEAMFHKWMPNQSAECSQKLNEFFKQWWDTAYTGTGNKPRITGPGLAGQGFYDANGGCSDYGVAPVSATVPATLSLTLGTPATFGTFTPGFGKDYTSSSTANVISSAGDAALSVADPSTNVPGHLVNGAFSLPSALKVAAASPAGTSAGTGTISGAPLSLLTWTGPVSNDAVDDDVHAAGRGDRRPPHGRLRQDPDVHAVTRPPRKGRPSGPAVDLGQRRGD